MEDIEELIAEYLTKATKESVDLVFNLIIGDLTALVGLGMNLGGADGEIYAEAVQECIRAVEKRREVLANG